VQTNTEIQESARDAGLIYCGYCKVVSRWNTKKCRSCSSPLHSRTKQSVNHCWAFTISAIILLVPANTLPIMTIVAFGQGEPDTILSGIISLFNHGLYPIGIIVFLASIMIPILKIVGLMFLLISLKVDLRMSPRARTKLYRVVEFFGKWSMLDVFVVSFLVALVDLGGIATVNPGIGVTAFCAMVILTMLAAHSFDSRLIWDQIAAEPRTKEPSTKENVIKEGTL